MVTGLADLAGFIPTIKDYGLGAASGTGGRCGFAGISQNGDPGLFYEFNSAQDARATLGLGPALEQICDLFEDGVSSTDRELNVQTVVYREMDDSGGGAASGSVDDTGKTGDATYAATAALPNLDRTYAFEITKADALLANNVAEYMLCRNYDVVDPSHRVWEGPFVIIEDSGGGTSTIYLEEPGTGFGLVITGVGPTDFDLGDLIILTATAKTPTTANALAAIADLAAWRDPLGNPIGGTSDITIIGNDRTWADTEWDDVHSIATDEWNNNFHPVHLIISYTECSKSGSPETYDIDTWIGDIKSESGIYRGVTLPGNADLNGAMSISAIWLLRESDVGYPGGTTGAQVRHQCGALVGQSIRARWQWDIGWAERFHFKGAYNVYPWNSELDNMTHAAGFADEYRTADVNEAHFLVAWPRPGYIRKIIVNKFWAMCDNLSDYFKMPYYRIVGATHVVLRIWFATRVLEPGLSSNDAAFLEAEINGSIIKPRIVDPSKAGDPIIKPYNDAYMSVWAEPDVLITETLDYSLAIVPVGSKYQLAGFTQLRRSL
jgi:hypothetical protein